MMAAETKVQREPNRADFRAAERVERREHRSLVVRAERRARRRGEPFERPDDIHPALVKPWRKSLAMRRAFKGVMPASTAARLLGSARRR